MKKLFDKLPVIIFCCLLMTQTFRNSFTVSVAAFLSAIFVSALAQLLPKSRFSLIGEVLYAAVCFVYPQFLYCFPVAAYDISAEKRYPLLAAAGAAFIYYFSSQSSAAYAMVLVIMAFSVILQLKTEANEELRCKLISVRDSSAEINMQLTDKNRDLYRRQDSEIHLATLRERNRIAREIHDNVGHLLSRSILQVEAMRITAPDEMTKEGLSNLSETLNNAMTSVRQSVHNLHDESVDLKNSVLEAIKPLSEKGLNIHTELSFSEDILNNIKFAFIAIVKEAAANIIKHSSADSVSIIIREHPAFCQLMIDDNGKCGESIPENGIGLSNMRERVEKLGGIIRINSGSGGFRIFISVKK